MTLQCLPVFIANSVEISYCSRLLTALVSDAAVQGKWPYGCNVTYLALPSGLNKARKSRLILACGEQRGRAHYIFRRGTLGHAYHCSYKLLMVDVSIKLHTLKRDVTRHPSYSVLVNHHGKWPKTRTLNNSYMSYNLKEK